MTTNAVEIQRSYYTATAAKYDDMHGEAVEQEHDIALTFLVAAVKHFDIKSVLDVGSGTGRTLLRLKRELPDLVVCGVEPSGPLREIGYSKGLTPEELIEGDAMSMHFADGSFDLVCEFAALHHIPDPKRAVSEMLRVARKGVFISDNNNFGHGSIVVRSLKQLLDAVGLWKWADFIKTNGKGYRISDGDGLSYSYSVFTNYKRISRTCRIVHLFNTAMAGPNLYRSASHVALLGLK